MKLTAKWNLKKNCGIFLDDNWKLKDDNEEDRKELKETGKKCQCWNK